MHRLAPRAAARRDDKLPIGEARHRFRIFWMLSLAVAVIAALLPGSAGAAPTPASAALTAARQTASAPLTRADVEAWLDGLVPALIDSSATAGGVVVSIVKDGELVTARGYGAADNDTLTRDATPLDPQKHLVRIGSISKTFAGLAVMLLVEAGRLDLDADVRTYLDFDLDAPQGTMTLRHLLSHTAGFEERFRDGMAADAGALLSLRDTVALDPPRQIYSPGTIPAYSNYGIDLVGYVVQAVSGMPYETYVETRIMGPLGMTSSSAHQPLPTDLGDRMADGYAQRGTQPGAFELLNSRPAGGLTASATDMATWMNALLGHGPAGVISPSTREAIIAGTPPPGVGDLAEAGYVSLGFHHEKVGETRVLAHRGDTPLFHSEVKVVPAFDAGVFVAVSGGGDVDVREEVAAAFLRRYVAPLRGWPERPQGHAEHAEQVAGVWVPTRRAESSFAKVLTGSLRIDVTPDGDLAAIDETWREVAPFVWENDDASYRIAARRDADGQIEALARVGYSALTPGGALDTVETVVVAVVALLVLLIAVVTCGVVWLGRRRAVRGGGSPGVRGSVATATRRRRFFEVVAVWTPVALVAMVATSAALLWPMLVSDVFTQRLSIALLRAVQVLLALGAVGTLVVVARVGWTARSRRWLAAAGWLVVAGACLTLIAVFVSWGFHLPDVSY